MGKNHAKLEKIMTKFMALLAILLLSFINHICVLMYGWGLTPKNWSIILTCFIVSVFLTLITAVISADK